MNAKESILARVREALKEPAPLPGQHRGPQQHLPIDASGFRQWLPPVGKTFEEQCALLAQNAAALKADFRRVPTAAAAGEELRRLAAAGGWTRVGSHRSPLLEAACVGLGVELLYTDKPYGVSELEKCEAGVTACEALVAQTGSVLITSRSCGGRAVSVLPPHHVVVATRDQVVPDLLAAFELMRRKYDGNYPSTISFITGPSRTGDIERILVLGAHGPKQLTILLVA
jgi:L-lactate dehydrogenase complex protein LldG